MSLGIVGNVGYFQLALKHRQGKNHKTRIVVFIGSPIEDDEKEVIAMRVQVYF